MNQSIKAKGFPSPLVLFRSQKLAILRQIMTNFDYIIITYNLKFIQKARGRSNHILMDQSINLHLKMTASFPTISLSERPGIGWWKGLRTRNQCCTSVWGESLLLCYSCSLWLLWCSPSPQGSQVYNTSLYQNQILFINEMGLNATT